MIPRLSLLMTAENNSGKKVRIDKWLWAARFFKTRSLASQAVDAGKAQVNGARVKPSKDVRPGDEVRVRAGDAEWLLVVRDVAERRGSADIAQTLYDEREDSRERRMAQIAQRKVAAGPVRVNGGRPTKRDRRLIHRFTGE